MFPGDPTAEVAKKLYELLSASAAITALVGTNIFDHVVDNASFPYIKIGPLTYKDLGSHTTRAFNCEITLKVFTSKQNEGTKEADIILAEIYKTLDRTGLTITDLGMVTCHRTFQNTFREPGENLIYQGIVKYTLIMGG